MRTAMVSLVLEEGVGISGEQQICGQPMYVYFVGGTVPACCLLLAPALLLVSCVDQNQKRRVPELSYA